MTGIWGEIVDELLRPVADALPGMAILALAPAVILLGLRAFKPDLARLPRWSRGATIAAVLMASVVAGYRLVWGRLALFDDAYISFRYARNFADGNGLVWNIGEQVEGYTNFLWTFVIGLLIRWTPWEAPEIGLWLSLACFAPTLVAIALLGRRLVGSAWLPLAVPLYALHTVATAYGSTGMETGLCALLVTAGALALVRAEGFAGHAAAGLVLILTALTRPDHGIFYAVGAAVVAGEQLLALVAARRGGERAPWRAVVSNVLGYAAPFALYGLYMVWKLDYYGHVLPNTWWAKGGGEVWYSQGVFYLLLFWVGTNAWIPGLMAVVGAAWPGDRAQRRFGAFVVGSVLLFDVYVARVGGDYMHGRFLLSLLPLVLVGGEVLAFRLVAGRRRLLAAAAIGVLLASAWAPPLFPGKQRHWHVVDENRIWPVSRVWPEVEVDRPHWRIGRFLRDEVRGAGLEPVIGTGSIGMVGYYSGLELVDCRGLTDAVVARRPVGDRSKPGHEKKATRRYLQERGVHLLRSKSGQQHFHPERFRELTRFSMKKAAGTGEPWQIARYERELMSRLADVHGVEFVDFDRWLDRYVADLEHKDPSEVAADLPWLRSYWFDHNADADRLTAIEYRGEGVTAIGLPGREFVVVSVGELLAPGAVGDADGDELAGDVVMGSLGRVLMPVPVEAVRDDPLPPLGPAGLQPLARMGVDLVSLANPHAMDYGTAGVVGTIDRLERRDIDWVGAGPGRLEARRARTLAGAGLRISVIGVAAQTAELARSEVFASKIRGGVWRARGSDVARTVTRLRERRAIDFVVAVVDWGDDGEPDPAGRRELAAELIGAGVDLIDGNGAAGHEGFELVDGVPVVWGKGRFGTPGSSVVRYAFADGGLDRVELSLRGGDLLDGEQALLARRLEERGVSFEQRADGWFVVPVPRRGGVRPNGQDDDSAR